MSDILFGIKTILPIILIIAFGFYLRVSAKIGEEFISSATKLVFYYALPAYLFLSVCDRDIRTVFRPYFVLYAVGITLIIFFASLLIGRIFIKDRTTLSSFVHGMFRGNFAYIGMAVLENILPDTMLTAPILIFAIVVPLYNVLGVIILSIYGANEEKPRLSSIIKNIITNPLIVSLFAGIVFSLLPFKLPDFVSKTLDYMASLATPLALIFIGASLNIANIKANAKLISVVVILRQIILPFIAVATALSLNIFNNEEIATIYVLLAIPAATNTFVMASEMGGDKTLAAGIVTATTLASALILPLGIIVLRALGIV